LRSCKTGKEHFDVLKHPVARHERRCAGRFPRRRRWRYPVAQILGNEARKSSRSRPGNQTARPWL